ncbi:galactose-3-O-sulfotransferase 2 [Strongylocentrotus purpuratus]|uniref:Galactosylceramide sulfotransferase-like n=1 Tax=Strongylocentrotus purpuratus TaxID=7668 RepID=A0A7M7HEZ2_STRPU|nr:galactose-3-O-sulfotransferase 2 [Strongylocentrotus purpuratus]
MSSCKKMARAVEPGNGRRNIFVQVVVFTGIVIALDLVYSSHQSRLISVEKKPKYDQRVRLNDATSFRPLGCSEVHHVVFLKTHKTGSTTVSSVFQRFGTKHNLTFLVPDYKHILSETDTFNTSKIGPPTSKSWNFSIGYQMFTNHIRYNRSEMDKVLHNATYVTILRNPVAQFESGFYYFKMDRFLPKSENPIELFMSNPMKYYNYVQQKYPGMENRIHSMQLYDLGMDPVDMYRMDVVDHYIKQLDRDFNLVMINEYFDESLVLLRKLLCWKMTDITYISKGIRSATFKRNTTDELRSKILQWNTGDAKLYSYFNKTFWEKVRNYDGDFEADMKLFKKHQEFVGKCIARVNESRINDNRIVAFIMVKNAPKWCNDYDMSDIDSTEKTCVRMHTMGIPQYHTGFHERLRKHVAQKKRLISSRLPLKHPDSKMKTKDRNIKTNSSKFSKQKST